MIPWRVQEEEVAPHVDNTGRACLSYVLFALTQEKMSTKAKKEEDYVASNPAHNKMSNAVITKQRLKNPRYSKNLRLRG